MSGEEKKKLPAELLRTRWCVCVWGGYFKNKRAPAEQSHHNLLPLRRCLYASLPRMHLDVHKDKHSAVTVMCSEEWCPSEPKRMAAFVLLLLGQSTQTPAESRFIHLMLQIISEAAAAGHHGRRHEGSRWIKAEMLFNRNSGSDSGLCCAENIKQMLLSSTLTK